MKNTFKDIIKPIVVLVCICLVVAALLAYVNTITSPIIKSAEDKAQQEAMTQVLVEADEFEAISLDNAPERVKEIYSAKNGTGYVFILMSKGYGGDIKIICGIKSDGTIEKSEILSHNETSGLGSKTAEDPYKSQYCGKDEKSLDDVDAISGATISSNAYMNGIKEAFEAYKMIKEAK